jgi:hypothetical protein
MNRIMKLAGILALSLGLFAATSPTGARAANDKKGAGKQWNKNHPRRHEVNKRLKNQNKRISQGVKSGKLTKQQAQQLRQNDKSIRAQERADAAKNGGHITKGEQKQLNQEENANSKEIYQEKHDSPAPAPASNNP